MRQLVSTLKQNVTDNSEIKTKREQLAKWRWLHVSGAGLNWLTSQSQC